MGFDEIKELIDIMKQNDLSELEIEKEGLKIRLKKNGGEIVTVGASLVAGAPMAAAPAAPRLEHEPAQAEETAVRNGLLRITSPMVGTYYDAPSPDANPYIEPSDVVEAETVVCIIEAMKVMNEIKAEVEGRVAEKLVANGEAVEFGQTLFLIDPNV